MDRRPAKLTYYLARNYTEQNQQTRRRGKQNANKPQTVQKSEIVAKESERNNVTKSNESGSNAPRNLDAPRMQSHRHQLPTVKIKRTNNNNNSQQPAHQNVATRNERNEQPRNESNTEETNRKPTRRSRRRDKERHAKFIADKIANKRK